MQYFRDPYLIQKKDKLNLLQSPEKRLGLYFWQLGQVQCGHKSCVCAIAQQENRKNRWGLKCCCSRNQAAVLLQLAFLKAFLAKQQLLVYYTRELESKAIKRPYHAVLSRDTYPALSWNHTSPQISNPQTIINIIRCPTLIVKALCLKVESHKAVGFEKYKVHYCLATIRQMQLTTNSASFSAFLHALLVLCFVYRRPRIRNMPALYNTRKLFVEKWLSPQNLCYG